MIRLLSILLFGTLFFACLLTPLVYGAALSWDPSFHHPFSRVFDRVAMVVTLVLILVYRRSLNLKELPKQFNVGLFRSRITAVSLGVVLSLGSVLWILPFIVGDGELVWAHLPYSVMIPKFINAFVGAVVISVIEETFFRGLLFQTLKSRYAILTAAIVTSALYAVVHFISPVKDYNFPVFKLTAGFEYLGAVVSRAFSTDVLPALFGLFLVGLVLCAAIQFTRSLYFCIGLHAGWVIGIKSAFILTGLVNESSIAPILGRRYFLLAKYESWISILIVACIVCLISRVLQARARKTELAAA